MNLMSRRRAKAIARPELPDHVFDRFFDQMMRAGRALSPIAGRQHLHGVFNLLSEELPLDGSDLAPAAGR